MLRLEKVNGKNVWEIINLSVNENQKNNPSKPINKVLTGIILSVV